jgi:hypothetical protein
VEQVYHKAEQIIATPLPYLETVYPDQSLSYALLKLKKRGPKENLKVVDRLNTHRVLGEISMQSIFDHIEKADSPEPS